MIGADSLNAAITQFNYLCAIFQRGEPVGNDENSEILAEAFDGLHDGLFGYVVQRAGGFVKDDDIGLLVKARAMPMR